MQREHRSVSRVLIQNQKDQRGEARLIGALEIVNRQDFPARRTSQSALEAEAMRGLGLSNTYPSRCRSAIRTAGT